MKALAAMSACALLALSAPAFAQSAGNSISKELQQNGSPNGADPSHAKQPGAPGAESGPPATEGRSSASDPKTDSSGQGAVK